MGLVFVLYRYRLHQVRTLERTRYERDLELERTRHEMELQMERTRQRIADDLHDDLGSTISGIARSLEMIGLRAALKEPERHLVLDTWQGVRSLLDDLRDTIWIVDTQKEQLGDLLDRMQEVARKQLQGRSFCFNAPEHAPLVTLDMRLRRHVFLMYKELLHNASRHAHASQVDVTVTYHEGVLTVLVKDDGVGFDEAKVKPGRGLWSLRTRAEELGGQLTLESCEGCGTSAQFFVSIG